jgi:hypothetical protein
MKHIILATALALGACSGDRAADATPEEANAPSVAPPDTAANADPVDKAAMPAANAATESREPSNRAPPAPTAARPYQPLPDDTPPPPVPADADPHAGHDMNNMQH